MSLSALVLNGVRALRPGRVSFELAAKPSLSPLQRRRNKLPCLKPPAITALALAVLILLAALPQPSLATPGIFSPTTYCHLSKAIMHE